MSEVRSIVFKTQRLNFGSIVRVPLSNIVTESAIITAISKTLRISENRLVALTKHETL